jgi:hypothetical protein
MRSLRLSNYELGRVSRPNSYVDETGRRKAAALPVLVAVVLFATWALLAKPTPALAADYGPGDTGIVNVSKTTWMAEGEEPLAVDPTNPLNLVAVSNTWQQFAPPPFDALPVGNGLMSTGLYVSNDGGLTWKARPADRGGLGTIPNPLPASVGFAPELSDALNVANSDADAVFDGAGRAFYESGDIHGVYHHGDETATVWTSSDGGRNWDPPGGITAVSGTQERAELDRPWFAVDRSGGPRDGLLYMTFETTPFVQVPPEVYVKTSSDHGRTWGPTHRVDYGVYTTQWNARAKPVVGSDGTLYVVYDQAPPTIPPFPVPQLGAIRLVLAKSTDGGQTFTQSLLDDGVHRVTDPDEALTAYTEMIPAIAADPVRAGRVAIAWPEADGASSSRIVMRYTTDAGAHWSKRVDIADDPPAKANQHDHITLTWLRDGRLVALWRDRRCCDGGWDSSFQEFARTFDPDPAGGLHPGRVVEFTKGPQPATTEARGNYMPDEFQGLVSSPLGVSATWAQKTGKWTDVVFRRLPLAAFDTAQLTDARCARARIRLSLSVATPEPLRDARVYVNGRLRGTFPSAALGAPLTVKPAAAAKRTNRVAVVVTTAAGTELRAERTLGRCPTKKPTHRKRARRHT